MSPIAWEVISRLITVLAVPHSAAIAAAKLINVSTKRRLRRLAALMETSAFLTLAVFSGAVIHTVATDGAGPEGLPVTEDDIAHAVGLGATVTGYLSLFGLILVFLLVCRAAFTWSLSPRGNWTARVGLFGPPLLVLFININVWQWIATRFEWSVLSAWQSLLLTFGPSGLLVLAILVFRNSPSLVAKVSSWLDESSGPLLAAETAGSAPARSR